LENLNIILCLIITIIVFKCFSSITSIQFKNILVYLLCYIFGALMRPISTICPRSHYSRNLGLVKCNPSWQLICKLIFLFKSNIDSMITEPFSLKLISMYSLRLKGFIFLSIWAIEWHLHEFVSTHGNEYFL